MPQDLYSKQIELNCRVMKVFSYAPNQSAWWDTDKHIFANETHESSDFPSTALIAERDPTRSDLTRNLLIDRVCLEDMREIHRIDPRNKDAVALINPGRRRAPSTPRSWNFSLRNYNLQPDQVIDLHMPVEECARHMARTPAQIHLCANVDSCDIEFVLGGSLYESDLVRRHRRLSGVPHNSARKLGCSATGFLRKSRSTFI
ncbi:hypothetical protein SGCOL_006222 [Colletotrichum sp. CLE4]